MAHGRQLTPLSTSGNIVPIISPSPREDGDKEEDDLESICSLCSSSSLYSERDHLLEDFVDSSGAQS